MLNSESKKSFWAFRQNRKALKHIFDIQKGDKLSKAIADSNNNGFGTPAPIQPENISTC